MNWPNLKASLLVAMPQMQDPNFSRSVILLVEHDAEASFGLVLNRQVDLRLVDLFRSLGCEWHGAHDERAAWGGPVSLDSGWMLFGDPLSITSEGEDINSVVGGVNIASSMDVFQHLAGDPPQDIRFFLGYSGWGRGQLEFEIAQGAWLSAEATPEIVFGFPVGEMWESVVRGLGIDPGSLVATSGVH